MSTLEAKKSFNEDEAVYRYLEEYDIYKHRDIGVNVAAIVKYAKEHGISLLSVPEEVVERFTYAH